MNWKNSLGRRKFNSILFAATIEMTIGILMSLIDTGVSGHILGVKGGQCGLFWPNGTDEGVGSFTNKAGKAYLEVEPAAMPAPVRGFIIAAPTVATGLDAVSLKEDNCYYDLFGRKVAEPQAGNVYIQNGKKVVLF